MIKDYLSPIILIVIGVILLAVGIAAVKVNMSSGGAVFAVIFGTFLILGSLVWIVVLLRK